MKALPKKLLPLTLFGIAVTSLFCVRPAQAYTVTVQQMAANVVANGSGAFNLTGLTFFSGDFVVPQMNASFGAILTGQVLGGWSQDTLDSLDRRVSAPGAFFRHHWQRRPCRHFERCSMHFTCHRAMFPILLYRIA
jgi:hypothetical protein